MFQKNKLLDNLYSHLFSLSQNHQDRPSNFENPISYNFLFISPSDSQRHWSPEAFNKGLQDVIEDIRRTHPDLESNTSHHLYNTDASVNGSLFYNFPCPRIPPSPSRPTSVHQLRPGDINVIAAIGDSLTAAKAAGSPRLSSLLHDYRGLSWSIGGDGTFQTLHSLPNILKEYNPDVYGFSNSIGDCMSLEAGFNVARSGATSNDLSFQASLLIQRIKNDPLIDNENDWKLITILIGGNDICRSCHSYYNASIYVKHLKTALDMLKATVPRAFINLVEIMPVELVRKLPSGAFCERIQNYYCQCAAFPKSEEEYNQIIEERKEFQRLTESLISSGIYDDKEDFTVVLQPFYRNATIPTIPGTTNIDYSFYAVDCFHYSAKGQSLSGLALWNNMLQLINHKSTNWTVSDSILCPTDSRPFLVTSKNSKHLQEKGGNLKSFQWSKQSFNDFGQVDPNRSTRWSDVNEGEDTIQIDALKIHNSSNTNKDDPNDGKRKQQDTDHLRQTLTIMVIATVAVMLVMVLAALLYYAAIVVKNMTKVTAYQQI